MLTSVGTYRGLRVGLHLIWEMTTVSEHTGAFRVHSAPAGDVRRHCYERAVELEPAAEDETDAAERLEALSQG